MTSSRQVFCAAEGRELVVYDAESDSNAGLPPRARYLVMGVRAVKTGPNAAELEVRKREERRMHRVLPNDSPSEDGTCVVFVWCVI